MGYGLPCRSVAAPDIPANTGFRLSFEEVTANQCLGTRAAVRETVGSLFTDLTQRHEEVKRRCHTVLQAKADDLIDDTQANPLRPANVDLTLASV